MPQPPLPKEVAEETVALIREHGTVSEASRQSGIPRATLESRLRTAVAVQGMEDPRKTAPKRSERPKVRVRAVSREDPPGGPITRVLGIGDAHDSPDLPDKSRFKWIGRHIAEYSPDYVVDIGDSCTFDSLCSYVGNDTHDGKLKPSVQTDLTSYDKAMDAMWSQCPDWKGKRHKTRGNHEDRIWSFENRTPEMFGMIKGEYNRILERYGIEETPFGQFLFIAGVGFVHVPLTIMGRPYGGKTPNAMLNDLTFDCVMGHSHRNGVHRAPKIGPMNYVKLVNLGCALPWGHVEDYAKVATTGWWWGVTELTLQGGHIVSENFIDMLELERRYG